MSSSTPRDALRVPVPASPPGWGRRPARHAGEPGTGRARPGSGQAPIPPAPGRSVRWHHPAPDARTGAGSSTRPAPGPRPAGGAHRRSGRAVTLLLAAGVLGASAATAASDGAAAFFRQSCASCHTIGGGRLTGPDLKDVGHRRDTAWLVKYLLDPKGMIDSGDPYAAKLLAEARGVIMPTVPGMSPQLARDLLDLIAAESSLDHSQFAGLTIPEVPFTAADVARGRQLFEGTSRLTGGGPACVSCHAVRGLGGLGGGRLGPDLTRAYERLGGRSGLANWLSAPATTTMRAVFASAPLQADEILPVVGFLEAEAQAGGEATTTPQLTFFLVALGGAVASLGAFGAIWSGRFRAVRRPLVRNQRTRGHG